MHLIITEKLILEMSKTDLTFDELKAELEITTPDYFLTLFLLYEILKT